MSFEGANRSLRLLCDAGIELVLREKLWVRRVKPGSSVSIHHPMAPAPRQAEFWLKAPPVVTPINQLCRVVLARGRDHPQTHSNQRLLPPLLKVPNRHRRATLEVYGESVHRVQQSRAVGVRFTVQNLSLEIAYAIGQIRDNTCRAAEEIYGMKVADDWNLRTCRRIGNRHISEIKIAAVETI